MPADHPPSPRPAVVGVVRHLWSFERPLVIALVIAVAFVIGRSVVFLLWEQAGFDADQAIIGLMAKHISEGRAFPMFFYGQPYLLAVHAWLAAPLFAVFGDSVAVLKVPVVLVNVATAGLLVWVLHRDCGLRPAIALLASLFFVVAPPSIAALLVDTAAADRDPFLYVLLLWVLRSRPLVFGVVFGIGFAHREFTAYGLTAIVGLSVLADPRFSYERLRAVALAGVGYLVVWQLVRTGFLFSTPFGPRAAITAPLGASGNLEGLAHRFCWPPDSILQGLSGLFGNYLGFAFGANDHYLSDFGVRSLATGPGVPPFWPLLGLVLASAMARVLWISGRDRTPIWRGRATAGTFLLLIGLQAGVAYALARCGQLEVTTFRYALLTLYLGVGVMALFFIYETRAVWRRAMAGVLLAWALVSVAGHVRLVAEYVYREPQNPRRELATYLVTNEIRYARAEYWTAYATTFLSGERVVVASTGVVRIDGYQRAVEAHRGEAVTVQRGVCGSSGGIEVVSGMYWVCRDQR